jgi:hypothetical protein
MPSRRKRRRTVSERNAEGGKALLRKRGRKYFSELARKSWENRKIVSTKKENEGNTQKT